MREQAEAQKIEKALYQESRAADVAAQNADLAADYAELDSMLAWTLTVDDYVEVFGGKKKHEKGVARARAEHEASYNAWHVAATAQ